MEDKDQIEETSRMGEFVPSSHQWIEPGKQRERAKELANMTKRKSGEKK